MSKGPLLVVGASAGGPQALVELLRHLPRDFPAPIVVIQHLDAEFTSALAHWLGTQTGWPIRVVETPEAPAAGSVWLGRGNAHLAVNAHGMLHYTPAETGLPYCPSIDVFFTSVARHWSGSVVAVLLTGMGSDGARGMLALHEQGAYTIAQDEASSAVYGMPRAAKELGAVDDVLSLDAISNALLAVVRSSTHKRRQS